MISGIYSGTNVRDHAVLRALSRSPFEPQNPKRSFLVDSLVLVDRLISNRPQPTPHLCGGSAHDKLTWEYAGASAFFESIAPHASLADMSGKDVIDVGCGWGGKSVWFAEHCGLRSLTGVDLPGCFEPRTALKFALSRGVSNCDFVEGFAEKMPVGDCSFDVLIMEDVLEHVRDPGLVINESYRVLRPSGKAIIKFPSFRMILAHHLDRAVRLPGAHYLLSMRTWAAGLNYRLLASQGEDAYEPFDRVVRTPWSECITENLNGLDARSFRTLVDDSGFRVLTLESKRFTMSSRGRIVSHIYSTLQSLPLVQEFLSNFILFIAEKPV
jgi:2-polyprenyl-3-methyl-5-hydroxy-6-metoxy-1,4-benzoquinol methylase